MASLFIGMTMIFLDVRSNEPDYSKSVGPSSQPII